MTTSLYDDLIELRADLLSIPNELGNPTYRRLFVRKAYIPSGSNYPVFKDVPLEPNPQIVSVPRSLIGIPLTNNQITVDKEDLQVKKLTRLFPLSFLTEQVEFFIVDPVISSETGRVINGVFCSCLDISDRNPLTWELILQKKPDIQTFESAPIVSYQELCQPL